MSKDYHSWICNVPNRHLFDLFSNRFRLFQQKKKAVWSAYFLACSIFGMWGRVEREDQRRSENTIAFICSKAGWLRAKVQWSAMSSPNGHCTDVSWLDSIKALTKQKLRALRLDLYVRAAFSPITQRFSKSINRVTICVKIWYIAYWLTCSQVSCVHILLCARITPNDTWKLCLILFLLWWLVTSASKRQTNV